MYLFFVSLEVQKTWNELLSVHSNNFVTLSTTSCIRLQAKQIVDCSKYFLLPWRVVLFTNLKAMQRNKVVVFFFDQQRSSIIHLSSLATGRKKRERERHVLTMRHYDNSRWYIESTLSINRFTPVSNKTCMVGLFLLLTFTCFRTSLSEFLPAKFYLKQFYYRLM